MYTDISHDPKQFVLVLELNKTAVNTAVNPNEPEFGCLFTIVLRAHHVAARWQPTHVQSIRTSVPFLKLPLDQ